MYTEIKNSQGKKVCVINEPKKEIIIVRRGVTTIIRLTAEGKFIVIK